MCYFAVDSRVLRSLIPMQMLHKCQPLTVAETPFYIYSHTYRWVRLLASAHALHIISCFSHAYFGEVRIFARFFVYSVPLLSHPILLYSSTQ